MRRAKELDGLDALILPGGESTTISKGLDRLALYEPIEAFARAGRPVLGTCAGAILLAREVENHPVRSLGLLDVVAVRNAYGTQVDSFAAPAEDGRVGGHALRVHPRAAAAPARRRRRGARARRRLADRGAPGQRLGHDVPPRAHRRPARPRRAGRRAQR